MRKLILSLAFMAALFLSCEEASAQFRGTPTTPTTWRCYFAGHYLEIGLNNVDAFGASPPPTDYYTTGTPLAAAYDYGHDDWSTGSPPYFGTMSIVDGWELQINGSDRSQAFTTGTASTIGGTGGHTLIGNLDSTSYSNIGGVISIIWRGTAGAGHVLAVTQTTTLDTNASWVVVTVKLHNTSTTSTIPSIYYLRTCDPDNDFTYSGSYAHTSTINYQHDSDNRVMASATGDSYSNFFVGLATKDMSARAVIYSDGTLSSSTSLATLWDTTYEHGAGAAYTLNDSVDGDYSIGLVYKIGSMGPGDSSVFSYAYIYSGVSSIDSALIGCPEIPDLGTISGPSVMCAAGETTFTDFPYGASHGTWSASNSSATITSAGVVTAMITGTDTISYTATNSCGSATATKVITVDNDVTAEPIMGSSFVYTGTSVTLSNALSGGLWSASNSHAFINEAGKVTGVTPGTDTISYAYTNACGTATATLIMTIDSLPSTDTLPTTGINNLAPSSFVIIYPNPTNGKIYIAWQNAIQEQGTITITDITGRELYKTILNLYPGNGSKQIDISSFNDGLYLVTVKSGTLNYNSKMQVQH